MLDLLNVSPISVHTQNQGMSNETTEYLSENGYTDPFGVEREFLGENEA